MKVNNALFPISRGFSTISNMKQSMDDLQVQLASGKRADTLSELGNNRLYDLTIRGRQSRITGYQSTAQTVDFRLEWLNNSVTRLDEIQSDARTNATSGGSGDNGLGIYTAQSLAGAQLDEVLSILSGDINGRYMFGGSTTDKNPVASPDAILNGSGGRDGFKQVAAEREQADLGANGLGRLNLGTRTAAATTNFGGGVDGTELLSDAEIGFADGQTFTLSGGGFNPVSISFDAVSGNTTGSPLDINAATIDDFVAEINTQAGANVASVKNGEVAIVGQDATTPITTGGTATTGMVVTAPDEAQVMLSEDGDHPFGMKLTNVSSTGAAIATSLSTGAAPHTVGVAFAGLPASGDDVTLKLKLPDGTEKTITLTATTNDTPGDRQFKVGATPADTAANFQSVLEGELQHTGKTELAAASVYAAADNFFNGPGDTIKRIDGTPSFYEATNWLNTTTANATTVQWYSGSSDANARQSVQGRIDDGTVVNYGVQANETGLVGLVRSLAAMSVESYSNGGSEDVDRYNAMASRQYKRLSNVNNTQPGSIQTIGLDIGIAKATTGQTSERQKTYSAQLDGMLSDIEDAPVEEVAMKLLNLQTRLQASYQTTSMISQLTLVNYIR